MHVESIDLAKTFGVFIDSYLDALDASPLHLILLDSIADRLTDEQLTAQCHSPTDLKDDVLNIGDALAESLASVGEDTSMLRAFLRRVGNGTPAAVRSAWEDFAPRLEALADRLCASPSPSSVNSRTDENGEGDSSTLAAYLADHPTVTEDEALAALPGWNLDKLHKSEAWKTHKERRILDYLTENPKASAKQVAKNIGCAKSTVAHSMAWKWHMTKRRKHTPKHPPKSLEVEMTKGRASAQEYRDARDFQRGRTYSENPDIFADAKTLHGVLLSRYQEDDSPNANSYRVALNRLRTDDRAALYEHLKAELGMLNRPRKELIELAGTTAESWIDGREQS